MVRRRKVDYQEFLQRLLLHLRMEAGSPSQVPQHQDWASAQMLDLPLHSHLRRHLPDPPQWMDHLQCRTSGPHPVSPTQSPEPAAFLASTGAGGAGPPEARRRGGLRYTPWPHRGPVAKDHGYRTPAPKPHQEPSPLLLPHWLRFPIPAESKGVPGAHPQPTQTRAHAGAGARTADATSSGVGHRHQAANGASGTLLRRGAWTRDCMETACEEFRVRVPRLWCKEKPEGDTTALAQRWSWGQQPRGAQAGDDRPEESQGKPRQGLRVRATEPEGSRHRREGMQLKGERGLVPIQGARQLDKGQGGEGQTQEEEGLAGGLEGQEREEGKEGQEAREEDEKGKREEGSGGAGEEQEEEGRGREDGSALEHVQASVNGGEDEEGLVQWGGQEEEGSKAEGGLMWGQTGGEEEEMENEEGLAEEQRSEEEEGSEEEGLVGQRGGEEEEEDRDEEEGLVGQQGGRVQVEEEDADSDLVLGPLGAGAQEGPGSAEQGRDHGRETPAWYGCIPEPSHRGANLGEDSAWEEGEKEEEEAESEGDEDIEAALAPPGNTTEPREKRTLESQEQRGSSQGSSCLEEGSRKVKVAEAPPASTTQWPRIPSQEPAACSSTEFCSDAEELRADLEMVLREDQSLDDQDDFYD
ncbi:uncharacterized protein LOC102453925 [Pelodiscus sinensis]|uniref:uncharacterized protein LOC102453925 n=1 Tax=Pelodiscus sinensis TaxID=13735 RepID=UPI003F6B9D29